jgi:hypothetical protein
VASGGSSEWVRSIRLGLCCGALLAACFATAPQSAGAADCPNEAIRKAQASEALPSGTVHLPACMALELVTPPKKSGQETVEVAAFSADGNRVLFRSKAALANTPGMQSFAGDNYVSSRGAGGWVTAPTSAPASAAITVGGATVGGPYAFGPDLGGWVLFGATQAQLNAGEGQIFEGGLGGAFAPLSPILVAIDDSGNENLQFTAANFNSAGTAADLSATVFDAELSSTVYLPGDPRDTDGDKSTYLAHLDAESKPALVLLTRDQSGKAWGGRCGSRLGGGGELNQGAISFDGSRIFFSTRPAQAEPSPTEEAEGKFPACNPADSFNPLRILVRTEPGPQIEELIPGGPAQGSDLYQGASLDGERVFLATPRKLASTDLDSTSEACSSEVGKSAGCDLYLHDSSLPPGEREIQISEGEEIPGQHEAGKGANVLGSAIAISPDGSHVYFVAQGVLTGTANPAGASPVAGKPNLYLYERDASHPDGRTVFVGTLAEGDKASLWGLVKSFANKATAVPLLGGGPEQGGDGRVLFFLSAASLIANDADGGKADVFRYDSIAGSESLQCVSCIPGGPDAAQFDAAAGINEFVPSSNFAQRGRWASEDGDSVVFATAQALVMGDEDGALNPYLWRDGELVRLPGNLGADPTAQRFQYPMLSADGEQVAFTTTEKLLPTDGDTARDAYLVRAGGGFPAPPPPLICDPLTEGSCQGPASRPGTAPAPASASFSGPGNQPRRARCGKGKVRRKGRCVKRAAKKKQRKRAGQRRGGKR